eukprot:1885482-Rhodomonas_salina.3
MPWRTRLATPEASALEVAVPARSSFRKAKSCRTIGLGQHGPGSRESWRGVCDRCRESQTGVEPPELPVVCDCPKWCRDDSTHLGPMSGRRHEARP